MSTYHRDQRVRLLTGDAAEQLGAIGESTVDCVVTSPPYWGLRDYGTAQWDGGDPACTHQGTNPQTLRPSLPYPPAAHAGADPRRCPRCGAARRDRQHGLESTLDEYVQHLLGVFAGLHRVLKPQGTVWLNLGDTYTSSRATSRTGIRRKNLLGVPWRVAFALQRHGWILRNHIVWHKPNGLPESVRDRLTSRHEHIFLLVTSERYYFNLDAIRETATRNRRDDAGPTAARHLHIVRERIGPNPGDVWTMPTRGYRQAHFATFPIDLPARCILAGSPPAGVVLDPFSGAATTGLAALQLGRSYIGIDLNPAFHALALKRLQPYLTSTDDMGRAA